MLEDDGLRTSLGVSAFLHVGTLLVLYFGLPVLFKPLPAPPTRFVPFDIVDIGSITNTRLPGTVEGDIKGGPPAAAKEPLKEEAQAESKKLPPPAPPKPDIPPPPPEATKGADKQDLETDEAALPKPQEKPKKPEAPKTPPKPQPDLSSILKNVAKLKPTAPQTADSKQGKKEVPSSQDLRTDILDSASNPQNTGGASKSDGSAGGGYGPSLSDRLTISQEDALRRQIGQCWNIPAGARNAEDLVVEVLIEVNPDRTVREAKIVDQFRASTDSFFRAAAESALRALRSPKCTPLELPPDQYEQWKTIRFNFDPRDIL